MKILLAGLLTIMLSACAYVTPIVNEKGENQYLIECNGAGVYWSHCYEKANELCPTGFKVEEKNGMTGGSVGGINAGGGFLYSSDQRNIIVSCNK